MIGLTLVLAFMTYNHYHQHLSTIALKDLMSHSSSPAQEVRIQGMVKKWHVEKVIPSKDKLPLNLWRNQQPCLWLTRALPWKISGSSKRWS